MNVSKKTIDVELSAADAAATAMAEGAIDLPQGAACQRIVSCDGRVSQVTGEAVKGAIALEGLVEFCVVYEDAETGLESVTGVCPFTHRMNAPQSEPGMEAEILAAVSSPSARSAGSARVLVSSVVEIRAELTSVQPLQAVVDAEDARLEALRQKVFWHSRAAVGKTSHTLREEVEVPRDLPEVAKVLSVKSTVKVTDVQALNGEAMIAGDLAFSAIYSDKAGNINRAAFSVPFGAPVQAGGMKEKMEARAWGSASQLFVTVGENMSDERRILSVEAPLFLNVEGYEPCEVEALEDAYHLDSDVSMAREGVVLYDGPVEISEKAKVKGALPRIGLMEPDSTLQAAEVVPQIDSWSVSEGRIDLSGRLEVRAYVRAADDTLTSASAETPFETSVIWEGASPDSRISVTASAAKVSAYASPEELTVEAELDVSVVSRRCLEYTVVTDLEAGAPLPPLAPLTLCVAGPNDTAWTLARRLRARPEDLARTNPELAQGVKPGMKLVILRK